MCIRNVPYTYIAGDLEQDIEDFKFGGHFDLLYLPRGRHHDKNLGIAFVNFHSSEVAYNFQNAFQRHIFTWSGKKTGCHRRASISAAHIQGFHANMEKLITNMFRHENMSLSCRVKGRKLVGEFESICNSTRLEL